MSRPCSRCRLFRIFLLGVGGALLGAWLAPRFGFAGDELLTPSIIGLLAALAVGVLIFSPRS